MKILEHYSRDKVILRIANTVFFILLLPPRNFKFPNYSWHETLKQQSQENNIIINHIHKANFIK